MFESPGPFSQFTFIYCHRDGLGRSKVAAFADMLEAAEFGRLRLHGMQPEWDSVVIARGVDADLAFLGSWERDQDGAFTWAAAEAY